MTVLIVGGPWQKTRLRVRPGLATTDPSYRGTFELIGVGGAIGGRGKV